MQIKEKMISLNQINRSPEFYFFNYSFSVELALFLFFYFMQERENKD